MKGTITKYRKQDGRVSWGYWFRVSGKQFTRSGFDTRDRAIQALDAAIDKEQGRLAHQDHGAPIERTHSPEQRPEAVDPQDRRPLSKYLAYWLDEHAALRCTPGTMELYRKLNGYLMQHLGTIRLTDLKPAQIQEMVNRLQLNGGAKTKQFPQGRPLSSKVTRAVASLLNTCLSDAVRLEHLSVNPMAGRRVRLPKRPKPKPKVIDPSMLDRLFAAAEGRRIYPFIVLAAASGARRGELCALTWDDINFENGTLTIQRSLEQTRKGGLRVKSTKSGEPRRVGLDDFVLEVLDEHRQQQEKDKRNFGAEYQDHGLVFCQPNGSYYSPNNVGLGVKELLIKAGLKGFSLHSLRHSHASVLLGEGVPLPVVSDRLGHANSNVTLGIYAHALPADVRAASKAWRNALAGTIAEGRSRKREKMLGTARKLVVNN